MNLGRFPPHPMHLCLYTLNFICHFIAQSLSPIRTLCSSSPFTIPTVKNQQEARGSFFSGEVSRIWAMQRDSSLRKVVWMSCCYTFSGQTEHWGWARAGRHSRRLPSTPPQKHCSLHPTRAWKHGEEQGRLALYSCTCCLGARLAMVQPHVC